MTEVCYKNLDSTFLRVSVAEDPHPSSLEVGVLDGNLEDYGSVWQ